MLKQFTPALATIGAAVITIVSAATAHAVVVNPTYQVDDGSTESTVGFTRVDADGNCTDAPGTVIGDMLWLNEFDVVPNGDWIKSVSISWGVPKENPCPNQQDPKDLLSINEDADGKPQTAKFFLYQYNEQTDALDLLTQAQTNVNSTSSDAFVNVNFDQTKQVKGRFFVGTLFPNQLQGQFPAALDTNGAKYDRSWIAITQPSARSMFDGSVPLTTFQNLKDIGLSGNWLLRANSTRDPNSPVTSVPESNPTIGLLAIAAMGTGVLLKRKLQK
jgi:hypothetical protein